MGFQDSFKKVIGLTEEDDFGMEEVSEEIGRKGRQKITSSLTRKKNGDIIVFDIKHTKDAEEVAIALKERMSCVINMQRCDVETERFVINFLSGTVFALDGDISVIGVKMYLCTPNGVSAFIPDEIQSNQSEKEEASNKVIKSDVFK